MLSRGSQVLRYRGTGPCLQLFRRPVEHTVSSGTGTSVPPGSSGTAADVAGDLSRGSSADVGLGHDFRPTGHVVRGPVDESEAAARSVFTGGPSVAGGGERNVPVLHSAFPSTPSAPSGGGAPPSRETGTPTVLSSSYGSEERNIDVLVAREEERRVSRQKKLFEGLIVFDGGALADHESLGTSQIMRDFLFFALYHKKWGYYPKLFRKYRQLMTSGFFDPIPYGSMRNQNDYELYVGRIHTSTPSIITPTQMFQPYYGWVIAEYLVTVMRAKFHPLEPLVLYDVGAGTGALAVSLLDYLAEHFPAVYETCEYHVIEQNPQCIPILRQKLVHHYHHTKIHNISILNWRCVEGRRCFVLGIELLSALPHDCILWSGDGTCSEHWFGFQQHDNLSTIHERYYPVKDPIILRYLRYLNWLQEESYHSLKVLSLTDGRENIDPPSRASLLESEMYDPLRVIVTKVLYAHSPFHTAWLPTVSMLFFEVLSQFFPRHHLFMADWSSVRQGLPGLNGPVLQSKIRIAKDIYLRRPSETLQGNAGMVDVCFPTNFDHLQDVYRKICGDYKEVVNMSHPSFWRTYGGDKTNLFMTRSGYNPLLEDFQPFHVFSAHQPQEM